MRWKCFLWSSENNNTVRTTRTIISIQSFDHRRHRCLCFETTYSLFSCSRRMWLRAKVCVILSVNVVRGKKQETRGESSSKKKETGGQNSFLKASFFLQEKREFFKGKKGLEMRICLLLFAWKKKSCKNETRNEKLRSRKTTFQNGTAVTTLLNRSLKVPFTTLLLLRVVLIEE